MTAETDALDATQDTMVSIARGIGAFDGRSSLSTWAYRVATNTCFSALRKQARRRSHEVLSGTMDTLTPQGARPGREAGAEDGTWALGPRRMSIPSSIGPASAHRAQDPLGDRAATAVDLEKALERVPPQFRIALVLRASEGLGYDEIAQVLGAPVGTVRSRISRARALLAEYLFPPGAEAGATELGAPDERQTQSR